MLRLATLCATKLCCSLLECYNFSAQHKFLQPLGSNRLGLKIGALAMLFVALESGAGAKSRAGTESAAAKEVFDTI